MSWLEHIKNYSPSKSASVLLVLLILITTLSACTPRASTESPDISGDPVMAVDPDSVAEPPDIGNDPSHNTDVSPSPEVSDKPATGPDVPKQESADDEFFEDAAFMGNSLMDGFRMFSGLTTCDYYAATSMSVVGATSNYCVALDNGASGTMVDGLTQKPYGKIYILLGINEIGMNVDSFIEAYGKMLDTIIAAQPDCDIYIMSLTPVSSAKSSSSDSFNMTRIGTYNDALHQLASDKGCYYLDLVEALADDTGFLPSNETSDGVHFSANLYKIWVDYVRTHYV